MKRIGILLLIVFLWSCGGSGEDTPTPLTNGPLDKLAQTYHIKDTVGLTDTIVSEKDDYHYLIGKKNGKFWLAQYDINTKEELYSFVDKEGKFKFTETVDLGFGETVEYKVDLNPVAVCVSDNIVGMSFDLISINEDKKCIYYAIAKESIIKSNITYLRHSKTRVWHDQSILFYPTAKSPYDRLTGVHLLYKDNNNNYIFNEIDYSESIVVNFENALPLSLFEFIRVDDQGIISRTCMSPTKGIWSTRIKTYNQDAKFNFTLLNQSDKELKYKANVTLLDGTKDSFEFTINIETGEVQL